MIDVGVRNRFGATRVYHCEVYTMAILKLCMCAVALTLPVAGASGQPVDDGQSLKAKFFKMYNGAFERIEHEYTHMQLTAQKEKRGTEGSLRMVETIRYFSNGDKRRVDVIPSSPADTPSVTVDERSEAATRDGGSFSVSRNDAQHDYVLKNTSRNYGHYLEVLRLDCPIASAPFGFYEKSIREFVEDPLVTITRIEDVSEPAPGLQRVHFDFLVDPGASKTWRGWFLFSPQQSWVLLEYGYTSSRCKLTYAGSHNGVPIVKTAEYWVEPKESVERVRERYSVTDVSFAPAPDNEFTLAAFGIPDVRTSGHASRNRYYLLLLAGAALLVLAWLGWRKGNRSRVDRA